MNPSKWNRETPASRADCRPIEDKALGLIFEMDDAAAKWLRAQLADMAAKGSRRAAMFLGKDG
jgi:hypothetical protein